VGEEIESRERAAGCCFGGREIRGGGAWLAGLFGFGAKRSGRMRMTARPSSSVGRRAAEMLAARCGSRWRKEENKEYDMWGPLALHQMKSLV